MKNSGIIFRKEMREMLRDRRVVINAFFGPIFLIFIISALLGFVTDSVRKPTVRTLHVAGNSDLSPFIQSLEKSKLFRIVQVTDVSEGIALVKQGKAEVLLELEPLPASTLSNMPYAESFKLHLDEDQDRAKILVAILERTAAALNKKMVEGLFMQNNIPASMAESVKLTQVPIKKEQSVGSFLVSMLPYIIVLWAFYGGIGSAAEMVSAEKERNTLETLLIAPISRLDIAFGKFFSLLALSFGTTLSALMGVVLLGVLKLPQTKLLFPQGISLSPVSLFVMLSVAIPLSAMFAGLLIMISTRSKNTRDCQTQLALVSFVVMMPAIFSQFIGFTDYAKSFWVNLVPVLNTANVLRNALLGKFETESILITITSCLLIAIVTMLITARLFKRESVLTKI